MKKRLLTLTATLALTALASWAPRAEANAFCSPTFCAGKPLTTSCACPPGTGFPGTRHEATSVQTARTSSRHNR